MRALLLAGLLALPLPASAAYEIRGVALGEPEAEVRRAFPSAHCQPLQWSSRAADRRCDDSRVQLEGIKVSVTFYLRDDAVQAFDIRFDTSDLERLLKLLRARYGEPASAGREQTPRADKPPREFYRARWREGRDRAVLSSEIGSRRSSLLFSRGDFEKEIYSVR